MPSSVKTIPKPAARTAWAGSPRPARTIPQLPKRVRCNDARPITPTKNTEKMLANGRKRRTVVMTGDNLCERGEYAHTRSYGWSGALRNLQAAFDRRPRQATFEPDRDMDEVVERDQFARAVKADQIAHPAEHRNIGDGVVVVHDPLPSGKADFHDIEQAL